MGRARTSRSRDTTEVAPPADGGEEAKLDLTEAEAALAHAEAVAGVPIEPLPDVAAVETALAMAEAAAEERVTLPIPIAGAADQREIVEINGRRFAKVGAKLVPTRPRN